MYAYCIDRHAQCVYPKGQTKKKKPARKVARAHTPDSIPCKKCGHSLSSLNSVEKSLK